MECIARGSMRLGCISYHLPTFGSFKNPDLSRSSRIDGRNIPSPWHRIQGVIPSKKDVPGFLGVDVYFYCWYI